MTSFSGNPWENSKWTAFLPISNYRSLENCQHEKKKSQRWTFSLRDHMYLCERKVKKMRKKNPLIDWNRFFLAKKKTLFREKRKFIWNTRIYASFSGIQFHFFGESTFHASEMSMNFPDDDNCLEEIFIATLFIDKNCFVVTEIFSSRRFFECGA